MSQNINYKKRWRSAILFLAIFIGIPWRVQVISGDMISWVLLLISWVPAMLLVGWVEGWIELPDEQD